jgi:hypothetical protein
MKRFAFAAASLLAMGSFAVQAADAQVRRAGASNGSGGVAAGQTHDRTGPNGGRIVGGRGAAGDGQGNAIAGGANCAKGANAAGCRAGVTTRSADGAAAHKSSVHVEGVNGRELTSAGSAAKTADGVISQGRTTSASGQNGSVTVDGAYSSETGRTRTVTCSDASGAVVACPQH